MTTARFSVRALWCDQGMAHMLETYDSNDAIAPTGLALVDFGAETMFKSSVLKTNLAAPAVTAVLEMLIRQGQAGLTPTLDWVVISHQDTDHWSLLNYLMDAVDELKLTMKVGGIIYAGADWGTSAIKTVKRLAKYGEGGSAPITPLSETISNYDKANGELSKLVSLGDVVLRVLIANAPIASKSSALRKNGTSAVIVTDFNSQRMILPGDATWETLDAANARLEKWTTSPVQPVKMMSAPHHGSLSTMTQKNEGVDSNLEQLEKFTELTKPEAVIASAGFDNSFKHPHSVILTTLGKHANVSKSNRGIGKHQVVIYMTALNKWREIIYITKNIYTTVLNRESPVSVANFLFTQSNAGFLTDRFVFYGPTKSMTSVPYTSSQMLDTELMEAESTSSKSDEKETSSLAIPSPRRFERPRLHSPNGVGGGPSRRFAPPNRRVLAQQAGVAS